LNAPREADAEQNADAKHLLQQLQSEAASQPFALPAAVAAAMQQHLPAHECCRWIITLVTRDDLP